MHMAEAQEIELHIPGGHDPRLAREAAPASAFAKNHVITLPQNNHATLPPLQQPSLPQKSISISRRSVLKRWKWWIVALLNIVSILSGCTVATLLGRFYFNEGGNSLWMSTLIQSAGAPLLLLPLLLAPKKSSVISRPPSRKIVPIYIVLGLIIAGDNLMYSYGLLYLPVSTYSLICATQLGFNAIFSYFINKQKFTILIFNSVVLLTFSSALLGVDSDSSDSNIPKDKYPLGFVLTVGASATFSLLVSLMELTFEKVIKTQTFSSVLELQIYCNMVATVVTVTGLFVSGQWRGINEEFQEYKKGKASYASTLIGVALGWQVFSVGLISLVSMVSSLFANMISTLALPLIPIFAVIFFHEGMNGIKVLALLIAVWGSLSYIYQHYLYDSKSQKNKEEDAQKDIHQVA